MLTTIVKTKNSQDSIPEVLESVKDLGKIVLLDEHSLDDTILIAKEYKAQIIHYSPLEFCDIFNQTLSNIETDWVLFLQGDEIVPLRLAGEIINYISNPKKNKNAVCILKKYFYLNKEIKSARKYELKLFKKDFAKLKTIYPYKLEIQKTKKFKFKNPEFSIMQYEKRDIFAIFKELIEKNILISKENNLKSPSVFLKPFLKFIKLYFIKGAIFDCEKGFIYSLINAIDSFILQCKNYENNEK